jgi:hypothetical protein
VLDFAAALHYIAVMDFDRLALRIRPAVLRISLIAMPVALLSYPVMIRLLYGAIPTGLFAFIAACHLVSWIGLAMLSDLQKEQAPRT